MERENGGQQSHDPAIFYDEASDTYYTYSTDTFPRVKEMIGGQIRRSKDLINFEFIGTALEGGIIPDEVKEHTNARGIWAPDIILHNGEYRLYYTASTFGSQNSVIGLAIGTSPEGPFRHRGMVVRTTPESPVNAIDANIITEEGTGDHYMAYGSFWGGIRLLRLDKDTGLAGEDGYGLSIARRNALAGTAIEGPYIRYNRETGYYYLFVSYDSLSNFYNVRVGRSRALFGPYLDYHGRVMTDMDSPPNHVGLKITTGYSFKKDTGFIALGHNSVLRRGDEWFMVCHARYEHDNRRHTLNIRKMFFTTEGWPVVSPMLYSGERLEELKFDEINKIIAGKYMRIDFVQDARHLYETPSEMEFMEDGTAKVGDSMGKWTFDRGSNRLAVNYGSVVETFFFLKAADREEGGETYVLTGMNQDGNCVWGKKVAHTSVVI